MGRKHAQRRIRCPEEHCTRRENAPPAEFRGKETSHHRSTQLQPCISSDDRGFPARPEIQQAEPLGNDRRRHGRGYFRKEPGQKQRHDVAGKKRSEDRTPVPALTRDLGGLLPYSGSHPPQKTDQHASHQDEPSDHAADPLPWQVFTPEQEKRETGPDRHAQSRSPGHDHLHRPAPPLRENVDRDPVRYQIQGRQCDDGDRGKSHHRGQPKALHQRQGKNRPSHHPGCTEDPAETIAPPITQGCPEPLHNPRHRNNDREGRGLLDRPVFAKQMEHESYRDEALSHPLGEVQDSEEPQLSQKSHQYFEPPGHPPRELAQPGHGILLALQQCWRAQRVFLSRRERSVDFSLRSAQKRDSSKS